MQGTAEAEPFDREALGALLDLATTGCAELTRRQLEALAVAVPQREPRSSWPPATRTRSASCGRSSPTWSTTSGSRCVGIDQFPDVADVVESGVTFVENATLKAVAAAEATGLPAVADDSGLAVDVLGGAPGVFSARWSGRHGDDARQPGAAAGADRRRARRAPRGGVRLRRRAGPARRPDVGPARAGCRGGSPGRHAGRNGFGYDPVLEVDGDARTAAELTPAEKNAISHRGLAFRALGPDLREAFAAIRGT